MRNGLRFLDAAIESIRAQTLCDWRWILVDDGSTDGTGEHLATWARRDPRLEIVHAPPRGLPAALNLALERTTAPIVARMDADDVAHPERLAQQVEALRADPELTVVDGRVRLLGTLPNHGMRDYVAWVNAHDSHASIAADMFVESTIVHPCACMRRRAVVDAGGYRDGDFPEDYDLWLRLFRRGGRFRKLGALCLDWRDHAQRLTRSDRRYRTAAFTALKQRHLEAHEGARLAGGRLALWGVGRSTRAWRQWLRRRGFAPQLVVDNNPRRRGAPVLGTTVRSPAAIADHDWTYLLVTVSSPAGRRTIRAHLAERGLDADPTRTVRFV